MSNSNNTTPLLLVQDKLKSSAFLSTANKYQSINVQCKPDHDILNNKILFDLIIDGYVRTQCHLDTDYLFPFEIKQIIASYYRFDLRAYRKWKQEIKKLQIATKLQRERCANYWRLTLNKNINIFVFLVSLVISIAAIIIGCIAYYKELESNHCNNNYSIIHPTTFTLIGGTLCLSHCLFIGLHRFFALLCFHKIGQETLLTIDLNAYLNDIKKRHRWLYLTDIISKWIMLIFYLVWSIIGFYMFQNEISHHCTHSNIAKIMISWSVIIFILAGYYYVFHSFRIIFNIVSPTNINDADYTIILKQKLESNKKLFWFLVPFIIISIFLLIMSQSKQILCNENYFILKPTDFTIIGGSVVILHIIFIFIISLFMIEKKKNKKKKKKNIYIADIVSWIVCIFYFVWSILGFYIYHNQLSSDCVETMFATLFIVWCIFTFTISFIYHIYFAWTIVGAKYEFRMRILTQIICTYPLLFLSIATMIVGIYGDETVCFMDGWMSDDSIGIAEFALIAGIVESVYFIIALFTLYINLFHDMYGVCGKLVTLLCTQERCCFGVFLYIVFYITWCSMGFAVYSKMPNECKHNILGQMIIIWCGIMCVVGPCYAINWSLFMTKLEATLIQ